MYALVEIGGKQYKVKKDSIVSVDRINKKTGEKIEFDKILMLVNGDKRLMGRPYLKNTSVTGEVVCTTKGKKVVVFKKKRRKDYKKTIGHRQRYTKVKITEIGFYMVSLFWQGFTPTISSLFWS